MNYLTFANLYDGLMKEAPYDQWLGYVKRSFSEQPLTGKTFLDVGCGTGELLLLLQQEGGLVTGLDLSEDMLTIAEAKNERAGFDLPCLRWI